MPHRYLVLDSLRGFCALSVVLFHVEVIGGIRAGIFHGVPFFEHGFLFVDFFFVLSGFVISLAYQNHIRSGRELSSFVLRRFGRVYPLHFLLLMMFVGMEAVKLYLYHKGIPVDHKPFSGNYPPTSFIANLFLVQAFGLYHHPTWNTPSWSISVEFFTYILFAGIVLGIAKIRPAAQNFYLFGVSLFLIVADATIVALCSDQYMDTIYDFAFFRCVYGFFCGVATQQVFQKFKREPGLLSRRWTALEIAALTAVVLYVSRVGINPYSLFAPLVFAPVIFIFAHENGWVSRLLRLDGFRLLGKLSYTMYISHAFFLILLLRAIKVLAAKGAFHVGVEDYVNSIGSTPHLFYFASAVLQNAMVALVVLAILVESFFLNRLVEQPARNAINRLAKRLRSGERLFAFRRGQIPVDRAIMFMETNMLEVLADEPADTHILSTPANPCRVREREFP